MKELGTNLKNILSQDKPILKEAESIIRQLNTIKTDLEISRLYEMEKFKEILTPEQKTKFKELKTKFKQHGNKNKSKN